MIKFFQSRARSFYNAFSGIIYVIRTQKNAWIHALATIIVIFAAFAFKITLIEWAVLFLTFALVWVAEAINTAIEVLIDLVSPNSHPLAKICKDVGAGAVLLAAIFAIVIGLIIFIPHLL